MRTRPAWVFFVGCAIVMAAGPGTAKEKIAFTPKQEHLQPAKPESCEMPVFAEDGSLTLDAAMPKIKARACRAGADALIDIRVTEVRRLEFALFNVRAVAIRFAAD